VAGWITPFDQGLNHLFYILVGLAIIYFGAIRA
jgi:hypothetical protein